MNNLILYYRNRTNLHAYIQTQKKTTIRWYANIAKKNYRLKTTTKRDKKHYLHKEIICTRYLDREYEIKTKTDLTISYNDLFCLFIWIEISCQTNSCKKSLSKEEILNYIIDISFSHLQDPSSAMILAVLVDEQVVRAKKR